MPPWTLPRRWAATLKWETGLLTYVNAGHNFPLLRHGKNGEWEWLKKKCGLFLGTFETARYRQETLTLVPGDELELRDSGTPFDPVRRQDPTKPSSIEETSVGGLGILMVKRTMDDFIYVRDNNENVVVFRKGW